MSNLAKNIPTDISGNYFDIILINHSLNTKDEILKKISKIYRRFQKNHIKSLEGILAKDVVWIYEGIEGAVPFVGTFTEKKGVKEFWKIYVNAFNFTKVNLRYYLHKENTIHLHWTEEGIVKSTGKKFIMETVQVWDFNDEGQLTKLRWYNDTFAMYHAFQPDTDPNYSLAQHTQDYNITSNGPADALSVVKNVWNCFFNKDLPGVLSQMDENSVVIFSGPSINPFAGVYFGHQGWMDFLTKLVTNYRSDYLDLYKFTTQGAYVDSEWEETVYFIPTGKTVHIYGIHSWVIGSNGKVLKFRSHNNTYQMAWGFTAD